MANVKMAAVVPVVCFVLLGALSGVTSDHHNHTDVCDRFHSPGSIFFGKYGKLRYYIGLTREEVESGDLKLTIDNCGGEEGGVCVVRSAKPNAAFEGNQDNFYKIVLTDEGKKEMEKAQPPVRGRRGRIFPVQHHVRLTLVIDSDITDDIPKIPVVSNIDFGGLFSCKPKPTTIIKKPICPRSSTCPTSLATTTEGGMVLTLPADKRRIVRFTVSFEDDVTLNATVTSDDTAKLRHKRRCGTLHSFILIRNRATFKTKASQPINITLAIEENPVPEITFFTSKTRRRDGVCGLTCGAFKECVKPDPKPEPVTLPPPTAVTTPVVPETEAPTAAPETEAPTAAPETEAPTAAPETEAPTAAPEPETVAPEVPETEEPEEPSEPEVTEEAKDAETQDAPEEAKNADSHDAPKFKDDIADAKSGDDEKDAEVEYEDDFDALLDEW